MADLSNLLGDVYGDPAPAGADAPAAPASVPEPPAWADESRLDEAFADWTPHPLETVVAQSAPASGPVSVAAPLDDDLAAALSAALADAPRAPIVAASVERFRHVDAPEDPTTPPVLDGATLEPVAQDATSALVDPLDALDALVVAPPVEVGEPTPKARRRSLSFSRSRPRSTSAAVAVPAEPVVTEPTADVDVVDAGPRRAWQPSDDDIVPAGAARARSGLRLR